MERLNRTKGNHFIPQAYLRPWADDRSRIWAYSVLVPHDQHPLWTHRSIRSVGRLADLYTVSFSGQDSDEFERWINAEVEGPAAEPLRRLRNDSTLSSNDWEAILRYVAALDLRTPTDYFDTFSRWSEQIPALLDKTLAGVRGSLEALARKGKRHRMRPPEADLSIPLNVIVDEEASAIRAEFLIGRAFWIERIRHLVTTMLPVLLRHRWSILTPASGMEWFTSDHPVVRLNYHHSGKYDFKGGWGSKGSEILVPLSPRHLLYTRIGKPAMPAGQLARELTFRMQEIIAQRAARRIFAHSPQKRVVWFRPRHVDLNRWRDEESAWRDWHTKQREAELQFRDPSST